MIVDTAREWIGVPWRHQGTTRAGVDCGGFIIGVAADLGIDLPIEMRHQTSRRDIFKVASDHGFLRCKRKIGCVAFSSDKNRLMHCGIVSGKTSWIHASALRRKVVETEMIVQPFAYMEFPSG